MSKSIWILNHYAKLGTGRHYKLAENLVKRGYDVKLFVASTMDNGKKNRIVNSAKYIVERRNGVECIYVRVAGYTGNGKKRIKNMIEYTYKLVFVSKKFDKEKPNIILASSVHPLTWVSGYRLARRYSAKFIAETRDLWPETLIAMGQIKRNSIPAKILYALERFIYKKADRLIFTLPGGKDYVENIGLDSSKVRYINNGIDIDEFNDNKEKYIYDDIDLNNKNTFKILYTGSMGQANELIYVIKAAERVKESGINNIKFILFGDGYQRKELEEYAKNNDLDNVIFKGKVEKKYISSILNRSNLNIFTGKHINLYKYGLSLNKMFDYFASSKPTLSNIECGYDILNEYDCGITVQGGSPEALVGGILEFYNMSQDEYSKYCKNALKAAKDFDFKLQTDKLEKTISELYPTKEGETYANTID